VLIAPTILNVKPQAIAPENRKVKQMKTKQTTQTLVREINDRTFFSRPAVPQRRGMRSLARFRADGGDPGSGIVLPLTSSASSAPESLADSNPDFAAGSKPLGVKYAD
jgi:hypothetical protein